MSTVLLRVEGQNNASGAINQAAQSLGALNRSLSETAASSSKVQSALKAEESALARVAQARNAASAAQARLTTDANKAALALDAYARAQDKLASATGDTTRLQEQSARAFGQAVTAQDRAAESVTRLSNAYATLNTRQQQAASASTRVTTTVQQVEDPAKQPAKEPAAKGGSSEIGSAIKQTLLYGVAGAALYQGMDYVKQSVTANLQYQRTLGSIAAETPAPTAPGGVRFIDRLATGIAASGTQPYDRNTIAQGAYYAYSAGVTDPQAITAIVQGAVRSSAASGAPDIMASVQAATRAAINYGIPTAKMGAAIPAIYDAINQAVITGTADPTAIPGATGVFAGIAAQKRVSLTDALGLFAQGTQTVQSPEEAAQDTSRFLTDVTKPQGPARAKAHLLGLDDYFGPHAFDNRTLTQWFQGVGQAIRLDPARDISDLFTKNAIPLVSGFFGPNEKSLQGNISTFLTSPKGVTDKAFGLYEQSPAAKFDDATTRFNTAVQTLTTAVTPAATAMLVFASSILAGKKPGEVYTDINKMLDTKDLPKPLQAVGNAFDQLLKPLGLAAMPDGSGVGPIADTVRRAGQGHAVAQAVTDATHIGRPGETQFINSIWDGLGAAKDFLVRGFTSGTGAANAAGGYAGAGENYGYGSLRPAPTPPARKFLSAEDIRNATLEGLTAGAAKAVPAAASDAVQKARQAALDAYDSRIPGQGRGSAAAARSVRFIDAPGIGALEAGPGSTAVRFAGQLDPEAQEIRALKTQLQAAEQRAAYFQTRSLDLQAQTVALLARLGARQPNSVVASGGGRGYKG